MFSKKNSNSSNGSTKDREKGPIVQVYDLFNISEKDRRTKKLIKIAKPHMYNNSLFPKIDKANPLSSFRDRIGNNLVQSFSSVRFLLENEGIGNVESFLGDLKDFEGHASILNTKTNEFMLSKNQMVNFNVDLGLIKFQKTLEQKSDRFKTEVVDKFNELYERKKKISNSIKAKNGSLDLFKRRNYFNPRFSPFNRLIRLNKFSRTGILKRVFKYIDYRDILLSFCSCCVFFNKFIEVYVKMKIHIPTRILAHPFLRIDRRLQKFRLKSLHFNFTNEFYDADTHEVNRMKNILQENQHYLRELNFKKYKGMNDKALMKAILKCRKLQYLTIINFNASLSKLAELRELKCLKFNVRRVLEDNMNMVEDFFGVSNDKLECLSCVYEYYYDRTSSRTRSVPKVLKWLMIKRKFNMSIINLKNLKCLTTNFYSVKEWKVDFIKFIARIPHVSIFRTRHFQYPHLDSEICPKERKKFTLFTKILENELKESGVRNQAFEFIYDFNDIFCYNEDIFLEIESVLSIEGINTEIPSHLFNADYVGQLAIDTNFECEFYLKKIDFRKVKNQNMTIILTPDISMKNETIEEFLMFFFLRCACERVTLVFEDKYVWTPESVLFRLNLLNETNVKRLRLILFNGCSNFLFSYIISVLKGKTLKSLVIIDRTISKSARYVPPTIDEGMKKDLLLTIGTNSQLEELVLENIVTEEFQKEIYSAMDVRRN